MIGVSMIKKIDQRNTIFTSRKKLSTIKKGTWIKQDLNEKINSKIPKKVKKIFFLSSPYYMNRNLFKKNSASELLSVAKLWDEPKRRKLANKSRSVDKAGKP